LDKKNIQSTRERFDYPQVAKDYRLIEDEGVSVVVRPRWGDHTAKVDRLLAAIRASSGLSRFLLRGLQPYTVSLRRWAFEKCNRERLVHEAMPGVWEWTGNYDRTRGLVDGPLPPEELVLGGDG
jgi:CRISPR-associated endonuclease/helicase Cas3